MIAIYIIYISVLIRTIIYEYVHVDVLYNDNRVICNNRGHNNY